MDRRMPGIGDKMEKFSTKYVQQVSLNQLNIVLRPRAIELVQDDSCRLGCVGHEKSCLNLIS